MAVDIHFYFFFSFHFWAERERVINREIISEPWPPPPSPQPKFCLALSHSVFFLGFVVLLVPSQCPPGHCCHLYLHLASRQDSQMWVLFNHVGDWWNGGDGSAQCWDNLWVICGHSLHFPLFPKWIDEVLTLFSPFLRVSTTTTALLAHLFVHHCVH